ncbi:MAG TPA: universal stress protein [Pseudonocardiaceae bacterium]|jgi:nucleotide-binding universal stress UspA family protein|nr:universal stress protein [Pseudonocardiaceae bacterium]
MATIVVGVDGSQSAQEALRVAVDEARLRGAVLRAVMAWDVSTMAYGGMSGFGPDIDPTVVEEGARAALDSAVDALGEQATGVEVERVMRMGRPAQVLVEEARGADLLVVGSRGHGGFAGLLLGSVSHQCALHAPCPVLIVHEPNRTG